MHAQISLYRKKYLNEWSKREKIPNSRNIEKFSYIYPRFAVTFIRASAQMWLLARYVRRTVTLFV